MSQSKTSSQASISSFLRLGDNESLEREYYITHSNRKRFPAYAIMLILFGMLFYCVPGVILLVYFWLRRLKISHGYACVTNKRVIYYEYNAHPEENYQAVKSIHLDDLTGISFRMGRTLFAKSFYMVLWSSKQAVVVGAIGWLGVLNMFGSEKTLEPGPDALQFTQDMSGAIASRKFDPKLASGTSGP